MTSASYISGISEAFTAQDFEANPRAQSVRGETIPSTSPLIVREMGGKKQNKTKGKMKNLENLIFQLGENARKTEEKKNQISKSNLERNPRVQILGQFSETYEDLVRIYG